MAVRTFFVMDTAGMMKRVSDEEPIMFAGGVAKNPCIHKLLEIALDRKIIVHENPQMVGALGAALLAAELKAK